MEMKRELRSYAPVVPTKTIPGLQSKMGQSLYPFSDQKGPKALPFGVAHTYMANIREYPPSPPPPPEGESSHYLPSKKKFLFNLIHELAQRDLSFF